MYSRKVFFCMLGIVLCIVTVPILAAGDTDDYAPYEGARYDNFDWRLLKSLESADFGNVVISPLSVKMVLAMLYEGATNATEQELQQILQLPVSRQATRDRFHEIITSLQISSTDYTLDMGSRVFLDASIVPSAHFVSALKKFYDTDVKSVEFSRSAETCDDINYWASNITHGKISSLVTEADLQNAALLLTNAIYFKGTWRMPFPRNRTALAGFYVSPSKTVTVPYMSNKGRYYYFESSELDAKLIRLPYKGGHLSMFVILPNSKAGLPTLIKEINLEVLKRHLWLMDLHNVHVILPKFKFDFNSKLGRLLQKLGIQQIFLDSASLEGIARDQDQSKKLVVSNVIQKAGIDVNEEGTSAWAATGVILAPKFGKPDYIFNASNPFLFYIEDEYKGTILFAGKVENPTQTDQLPFPVELNLPSRINIPEEPVNNSTPQPVTVTASPLPQYETSTEPPLFNFPLPTKSDLMQSFNYFDIELLKAIGNEGNDENILLSPISIKSTLAMILEGAVGQSADELRSAMRLSSDRGLVREQIRKLLNELMAPTNDLSIETANKIFVSDKVEPVPEYVNALRSYYFSNVTKINVSSPVESANAINYWVNSTTHGLIPTLVTPDLISKDTSIILANALYFNGTWHKSFDENGTQPRCFYIQPNECFMTYMMDISDKFKYVNLAEIDAHAVELPYNGGQYAMLLVLPNKRDGVKQLIRDMLHNPIHKIVDRLEEKRVVIGLPRFSIDYNKDLVSYLRMLDIFEIFNAAAQLNGLIYEGNVHVSQVLHKTKMEVNERGTIAAAATGSNIVPLMVSSKPRVQADHPFLFFIRHIPTGTVLFEGKVSRPEAAEPKSTTPVNIPSSSEQVLLKQSQYFQPNLQAAQEAFLGQVYYPGQINYPHRQDFTKQN